MTRKLVTVRTIDDILPIHNADAIEQLVIGDCQFKAISNKYLDKEV